jgi:hypothetical protein
VSGKDDSKGPDPMIRVRIAAALTSLLLALTLLLPVSPALAVSPGTSIALTSPWQRYVSACRYQDGTIALRDITSYTVMNLECHSSGNSPYPVVPILRPGEQPTLQDAAWSSFSGT